MHWTRTLTVLVVAVALGGCVSQPPGTTLREGLRMIDLYRGTVAPEGGAERVDAAEAGSGKATCRWWVFRWPCEAPGPTQDGERSAPEETPSHARTAANELELLFPRLPNPDVYIHVLPHLATESRVPVPGYTTAVPLYERVEYALPGETPGRAAEGGAPDPEAAP